MIDRDSDLHPLFCRRGLLVDANGGAVDHLDVAVVRGGDSVHQPVPDARLPPSHEAVVAGGARAVSLGQIALRRTGSQHPEDAVQRAAIIDARHAPWLVGQQRLDYAPLEVGQVVSAHADAESEFGANRKALLWPPDTLFDDVADNDKGHNAAEQPPSCAGLPPVQKNYRHWQANHHRHGDHQVETTYRHGFTIAQPYARQVRSAKGTLTLMSSRPSPRTGAWVVVNNKA